MSLWIAIPMKAPGDCKSRLRSVLGDRARRDLVAAMLRRVVATASATPDAHVVIAGPSRHGLPESIDLVAEGAESLNEALEIAKREALTARAPRLIILPGDIPWVNEEDIFRLSDADKDTIVIASDGFGRGTNALSLPLPRGGAFLLKFGAGSYAAHLDEAAHLGIACKIFRSDTLSFDVDEPGDLVSCGIMAAGFAMPDVLPTIA